MNDNEALMKVVEILAGIGLDMSVRYRGGSLVAEFEDGFYKSDGCAYLCAEDSRLYLHARYGEKTEVLGIKDIIRCSKSWHEFSEDRFDGWRVPPSHWSALYETLGPNAGGEATGASLCARSPRP